MSKLSLYQREGLVPSLFHGLNLLDSAFDREFSNFMGRFDLQEDKDGNYFLEFSLPGYKQEDIVVELKDNVLSITAKNEKRGARSSSVTVWADVDETKVEATLENGLLTVHLPKAESAKPRKIKVRPREVDGKAE